MIQTFAGKYRFLSNFHLCEVEYAGLVFPSTENAYQAAKSLDLEVMKTFQDKSPFEAKQMGKKVSIRKDWFEVNIDIMYRLCKQKFTKYQDLKNKLLDTGNEELVEGNHWGDTFWGVCNGVGENHLGKVLMRVREELREI